MESIRLEPDDCKAEGDDAPELYGPIVEYTRKHLVGALDDFTGYKSGDIESYHATSQSDLPSHRDGFYTAIVVTPKSRVGRLMIGQFEVFQGHHTWGASIEYCLHVQRQDGRSTIVIEQLQSIIGLRPDSTDHHSLGTGTKKTADEPYQGKRVADVDMLSLDRRSP